MLQRFRWGQDGHDMHMGEPGFLRKLMRRKTLEGLFLFVTARCNSRCRTCFYAQEKQQGEDLTFDEIRRMSSTAPAFDKLWLSGGEPTLREDLVPIVEVFHRNNHVQAVNFPTNGLLPDRAEQMVEQLLQSCPGLTIHLNMSVDGLEATHDAIRGVPGGFQKVTETLDRMERFSGHPRLHRNVATVVTPEGLDQLFELGAHLFQRYTLATQFFEIVRGDPREPAIKAVSRMQLEELHRQVMPLYDAMAHRLFHRLPPGARHLAQLYFGGVIALLYRVQEENVDGPHPWPMDCTAGRTTLVIDHNGAFRSCEMRPPVGRVQDFDFDLGAVLRSSVLRDEVQAIGGGARANCWCTHTCWTLSSMKFSPRTLLYEVPRAYLAYRRLGLPRFEASLHPMTAS